MLHIAVALIAIALASPLPVQQKAGAGKPSALEGTWVVQSINGQPAGDGSQEMTLTFAGANYHQSVAGQVNERGTFKVDATKKPMTIDLTIVEGSDAGKTQPGVFEVSGDTLRVHFDLPGGKTRPADMTPKEGLLLVVAKKKKA